MRIFLSILTIGFAYAASNAMAAGIYRCVGADEISQYSETKIAGSVCTLVPQDKNYSHQKTSVTAPATQTTKPTMPIVTDAPASANTTATATATPSKPAQAVGESKFLRMGYSTLYVWVDANDITHYASSRPRGIANVSVKRTEYPIFAIPGCFACNAGSTVNFGNVKLNLNAFAAEIRASSQRYGVEEAIVRAIIHAESAYRPHVVSPKNAQGLMQLIPATARRFGVKDAFDPAQNIEGGVQYLAFLLKRYHNDLSLASAAYNAGEGAVDRYKGVPPYKETRNYVLRVAQLAERYRSSRKPG